MKKLVVVLMVASATTVALAQEQGRVISSTPIVQQVAVPQQVCGTETYATQSGTSGAGAVVGAIAGGAVGNSIGRGNGRAAATALGLVGGALLGNNIESNNSQPRYQSVERCRNQSYYENRTVGYNVTYQYAGRRYTTQTTYPPGAYVPVQVSPSENYQSNGYGYSGPPAVYSQPGYVVPAAPSVDYSSSYYERQPSYYPPAGLSIEYNSGNPYRSYPYDR